MPPNRNKPQNDDRISESSSNKDKTGTAINGKARGRTGNPAPTSSLRDVVNTVGVNAAAEKAPPTEITPGIQWTTFPTSYLASYRHAHHIVTPPAFSHSYHQAVLSQPGIGKFSPTMARKREQRRRGKDQLASTLRRHFNSMGVVENDVVVEFLYKARWQHKAFRMHFDPPKSTTK